MIDARLQQLMIRALDNEITPQEAQQLEKALKEYPELRAEQEELLRMRALFAELKEVPKLHLERSVLEAIRANRFVYQLASALPRVAAACVVLIISCLVGIYFSEGSLDLEAILGVSELSPEDAVTYLTY
jgi:anti-sigma factor RsiW